LCTGQSTANISNGIPPYTFQWNDPSSQTTQTATGLCPGTYIVTVTDSFGCTSTATATIGSPVPITATTTATDAYCEGLCIGTATAASAGGTGAISFAWNDPQFQTGNTATQLCPGTYTVIVTDANGCSTIDSVTVNYSSFIPPLEATISDSIVFIGETVVLAAITNGNFSYSWTPVSGLSNATIQNPTANPISNTTYYVVITDSNGCSNRDSVFVEVRAVLCNEPEIFIPNAFTPNSDGSNDVVYVRGNTIKELTFKIYDRWGEKVFETNNPAKGWDGYYKGKIATPAVYVYYIEAVCFNNEKFFKKGNITLVR
jgi:gliding motility-associated-like protein